MALYPAAIKRLIPPGPNDPRVDTMVGTIGHVAVSMADSLHDYFNGPSGGVESHFYIRLTGVVEQYRDTAYEADANYKANSWTSGGKRYGFISYETEGMGDGTWTDAQLAAIKDLILWVDATHGSPLRKAPGPFAAGHGYHCLYPEWNYPVHSCPGAERVKQFNNVLVPWMATGGQEDDMFTDKDRELLSYISKQVKATAQLVVDYSNIPDEQLDAIASRVVSKLPGSIDGSLVKQAVKEALKEGTA